MTCGILGVAAGVIGGGVAQPSDPIRLRVGFDVGGDERSCYAVVLTRGGDRVVTPAARKELSDLGILPKESAR